MRLRRHRDGGFIFEASAATWMLTVCYARRRRDRYGRGLPFDVELVTGLHP